jgi:subtilisin family serine protease
MKLRIEGTRFLSILIVLVFVFGVSSAAVANSAGPERPADKKFVGKPGVQEFSGRLIVRPLQYKAWKAKGLSHKEAVDRVAKARQIIEAKKVIKRVWQTDEYIVRVPAGETEATVSNALMANGLFQYAEPDWIVYPIDVLDDPMLDNQWHHDPNRMQSADGWGIHTGNSTVSVGICDTGIRTTHQDLKLHRLEGYNAVDQKWESEGGDISPVHPHGTQTTGCAAANGHNGVGVAGVGWDLSHRMLRVSNSSGGGAYLSTLRHAARTSIENGDRVASVSYSGVDNSSNLTTATYIKSIGGLLVWAAGNDGRNLTYGNRDYDDIIVAGGTDLNDNLASFSAYGQFVDVTAPAVDVYTTDADNDSDYASVSGTSFATPLTAGLVALIWSYNPSLTPDQVESVLKQGCDDLGDSGVDNTYGYGRINVYGSLLLVDPQCETDSDPNCDDGDLCTADTCVSGTCHNTLVVDCDDDNACTTDSCNPTTGFCSNESISCDDSDPCTIDSCDTDVGCVNVPLTCAEGKICIKGSCIPTECDNDGLCESGENCNNCPKDCISGSGEVICGDGICDPNGGENCKTCDRDCLGKRNGRWDRQYCCGDGDEWYPFGCDERCTENGLQCGASTPYCCGDLVCEGAEDSFNCEVDCGSLPSCEDGSCDPGEDECNCPQDCGTPPGIETECADGIDNDCDGFTDGADPDCECGGKNAPCSDNSDCCSGVCKQSGFCSKPL